MTTQMENLKNYMEITYKDLNKINFPIFPINTQDLFEQDGLVYLQGNILDDRNQIGKTIGARRLQTPHEPLQRLRRSYFNIRGLLTSGKTDFIDSKGYIFIYRKSKMTKVIYHKISKVQRKESFTLVKLSYYAHPIKLNRPPPVGKPWVGMLYLNKHPWLPYEYSENYCAPKRRKI